MKKIFVITGSPRKGGNSDLLADALIKGAISVGHNVTKYDAPFKNIGACTACNKCFSNGNACVQSEDFSELASIMLESDIVVFATLLYWFSFSAQLKCVIDKLHCFSCAGKISTVKGGVLLAAAASPVAAHYDALSMMYDSVLGFLKWKDLGRLFVGGVAEIGDIAKTDALGASL